MKKQSLSQKILSKNYIVFIISLVISIAIWTYMSLNASNDTTVTISNIPIQMELSESTRDLGLQIFTGEEQPVASVTVTGYAPRFDDEKEPDQHFPDHQFHSLERHRYGRLLQGE